MKRTNLFAGVVFLISALMWCISVLIKILSSNTDGIFLYILCLVACAVAGCLNIIVYRKNINTTDNSTNVTEISSKSQEEDINKPT